MSPKRQRLTASQHSASIHTRRQPAAVPTESNLLESTQSSMLLFPADPATRQSASPSTLSPSPITSRASSFSSVEEASVGLADVTPAFFGPAYTTPYPLNSLGLYPDTFLHLDSTPSASALGVGPGLNSAQSTVFYIPDIDSISAYDYGFSSTCHRSPLRAHPQVASPCAPTMELLGSSFGSYPFPSSLMTATADMAISAAPSSCSSFADLTDLNDSEAQLHVSTARSIPSRGPQGIKVASAGGGVPDLTSQWSGNGSYEKSSSWATKGNKGFTNKAAAIAPARSEPRGEIRHADYESPEGEKKRLRTLQACEKCRVRKAKCNGERPCCGRCSQRNLECYYAPERRMRGPNKKGKDDGHRSGRHRRQESSAAPVQATVKEEPSSEDSESEEMDADGEVDYHPRQPEPEPTWQAAPAISQSSGSASSLVIPAPPVTHGFLPSAYAPKVSASRQPLSQSFSPSPPVPPSPYLPFHLSPGIHQQASFSDAQQHPYPPVHHSMGLGMAFGDGQYPPRPPYIRHGHSSSSSSSVSLASSLPVLNGAMLSPALPPDAFQYDLSGAPSRESPYANYANLPVHPAYQTQQQQHPQPGHGPQQYPFPTLNQSMQPYTAQPMQYTYLAGPGHPAQEMQYEPTLMERGVSNARSDMNWQGEA